MLRPSVPGATVRDANEDDAVACASIYAPYVRETAVSSPWSNGFATTHAAPRESSRGLIGAPAPVS